MSDYVLEKLDELSDRIDEEKRKRRELATDIGEIKSVLGEFKYFPRGRTRAKGADVLATLEDKMAPLEERFGIEFSEEADGYVTTDGDSA